MGQKTVKACERCSVCGRDLPERKKTGRPRDKHDDCKKLAQILSWSENLIDAIDFTPERASQLRGEIWRLGNMVKANGQGKRLSGGFNGD